MSQARFIGGAVGLVLAASLWWVLTEPSADQTENFSSPEATRQLSAGLRPSADVGANSTLVAQPSQQAIEGWLDPFLNSQLRLTFEAILLEAGTAATPELLKQRLATVVPRYFSPELAARALAMLQRYVDYRVALGKLAAPADASDPGSLRQAMEARQYIRERYFSPEEYNALFAQDTALDRYTVARLEIERNGQLTAKQKQAALQDTQAELSQAEQAARGEAVAHMGVADQTAAFDASNLSAQERYEQRSRAYGDAAAQRLATNDQQERDWQTRLGQYAHAATGQSDPVQIQRLRQLREQLFTSQEELRLDAALAGRAAR